MPIAIIVAGIDSMAPLSALKVRTACLLVPSGRDNRVRPRIPPFSFRGLEPPRAAPAGGLLRNREGYVAWNGPCRSVCPSTARRLIGFSDLPEALTKRCDVVMFAPSKPHKE